MKSTVVQVGKRSRAKSKKVQPQTEPAQPAQAAPASQENGAGEEPDEREFRTFDACAGCAYEAFWKRLERRTISEINTSVARFAALIRYHPDLQVEANAIDQYDKSFSELMARVKPTRTAERKREGTYTRAHEEAVFYLWTEFIEPTLRWPADKLMWFNFGAELSCIGDLMQHHPLLQREVALLRQIDKTINVLECSPALDFERWEGDHPKKGGAQ